MVGESVCPPCLEENCPEFGVFESERLALVGGGGKKRRKGGGGGGGGGGEGKVAVQNKGSDLCLLCGEVLMGGACVVLGSCGHVFHFEVFFFFFFFFFLKRKDEKPDY